MKDTPQGAAAAPGQGCVQRWEICSRRHGAVEVRAPNWVAALGLGLAEAGLDQGLDRVACERLPNGTIIVNDISRGERFTVRPLAPEPQRLEPPAGAPPYLDWMLESGSDWRAYSQDPLISIH